MTSVLYSSFVRGDLGPFWNAQAADTKSPAENMNTLLF